MEAAGARSATADDEEEPATADAFEKLLEVMGSAATAGSASSAGAAEQTAAVGEEPVASTFPEPMMMALIMMMLKRRLTGVRGGRGPIAIIKTTTID